MRLDEPPGRAEAEARAAAQQAESEAFMRGAIVEPPERLEDARSLRVTTRKPTG